MNKYASVMFKATRPKTERGPQLVQAGHPKNFGPDHDVQNVIDWIENAKEKLSEYQEVSFFVTIDKGLVAPLNNSPDASFSGDQGVRGEKKDLWASVHTTSQTSGKRTHLKRFVPDVHKVKDIIKWVEDVRASASDKTAVLSVEAF